MDGFYCVAHWVPHLRRGFIATKVGSSCGARSFLRVCKVSGFSLTRKWAHLSDDKTVAKMGHPATDDEVSCCEWDGVRYTDGLKIQRISIRSRLLWCA
jgi:hypothetical protein